MKRLALALTPFVPYMAWGMAFGAFWGLIGCGGGPPTQVQTALTATARGLVTVDEGLTPRYREQADACYASSADRRAYNGCMHAWDIAADAVQHTGHALRMAQLGRDSWESAGSEGAFLASAACLAAALAELAVTLDDLDVELPADLAHAVRLLAPYAEGQCR